MITSRLATATRLNSAASPTFLSLANMTNLKAAFYGNMSEYASCQVKGMFGRVGWQQDLGGIAVAVESASRPTSGIVDFHTGIISKITRR